MLLAVGGLAGLGLGRLAALLVLGSLVARGLRAALRAWGEEKGGNAHGKREEESRERGGSRRRDAAEH